MILSTAFQKNAFQNNAFQIAVFTPSPEDRTLCPCFEVRYMIAFLNDEPVHCNGEISR